MPRSSQIITDQCPGRLLITAGPTQEPIDAVRYIGNRSSGRLGVSLAEAAAQAGWDVTLLLGPTLIRPTDSRVHLKEFQTVEDLRQLLSFTFPETDVLVMAAAVSDYRPILDDTEPGGKIRRTSDGMTLHLEATPDLLAGCSANRKPGQLIVGFALEPRAEMISNARSKLERKGIDLVVANPLETMDSPTIEATIIAHPDNLIAEERSTNGPIPKADFACWLLESITLARTAEVESRA